MGPFTDPNFSVLVEYWVILALLNTSLFNGLTRAGLDHAPQGGGQARSGESV